MKTIDSILEQFPQSVEEHQKLISEKFQISQLNDLKGSYLFGAKELGKKISRTLRKENIIVAGFIDNNQETWGTKVDGVIVYPPDELKKQKNPKVIIANRYISEINDQLVGLGVKNIVPHYVLTCLFSEKFPNVIHGDAVRSIISSKSEILRIYNCLADDESRELFSSLIEFRSELTIELLPKISKSEEYFPGSFWNLSDQESFVDIGAFNGDTLKLFLTKVKDFNRYVALEPDQKNYDDFVKSIPENVKSKVTAVCAGAGNKNEVVKFSGFGREDSLIDENGTEQIRLVRLDDLLSSEKVKPTTVKVDVEGYEPMVLEGMQQTLLNDFPKLALCVYHRPDHLWTLPSALLKINPKYKPNLYLRHHETELFGTVLYAF